MVGSSFYGIAGGTLISLLEPTENTAILCGLVSGCFAGGSYLLSSAYNHYQTYKLRNKIQGEDE